MIFSYYDLLYLQDSAQTIEKGCCSPFLRFCNSPFFVCLTALFSAEKSGEFFAKRLDRSICFDRNNFALDDFEPGR